MDHKERGYDRPIEIADRIFWVGFHEPGSNFHCNPYLVVGDGEAVLIDAGSRPDFAVVMMKILQTGISPEQISALIYHHPDPDLCGSMSNMADICTNPNLMILSEPDNNTFLSYYVEREKRHLLKSVSDYGFAFTFGGRTVKFFRTPYAHSAGSFITYDERTKTVFTSDLFGSMSKKWDLFLNLVEQCYECADYDHCVNRREYCPIPDILEFHRKVMPSERALKRALEVIGGLDVGVIAPQHGSVLNSKKGIEFLIRRLRALKGVGIDGISE